MRTSNEPGRRQNSEVSTPNRPTLARHPLRTHIRSHGTKLDRNILETTAGATGLLQRKLRALQGPTQRWNRKGYSLIRFQATYGITSKGFITLTDHIHTPTS